MSRPVRQSTLAARHSTTEGVSKPIRPALGTRPMNVAAGLPPRGRISKNVPAPAASKAVPPTRKIAVVNRTFLNGASRKKDVVPEAFEVYEDENCSPSDAFNVIKQLEKLDKKPTPSRVPLSTIHDAARPTFLIGDDEEEEDECLSIYRSAPVAATESEYHSVVDAVPSPSDPYEPDALDKIDMYFYMRERETKFIPRHRYLERQKDLNPGMRTVLVDWLNDVIVEFQMETETLHLAVSLVDRLLSVSLVSRLQLQLVGTAALMIASKYELIYPPELKEFVYVTDESFTDTQVLKMERKMLNMLTFDISVPTTQWFVSHYCSMAQSPQRTRQLASYLSDLCLVHYSSVGVRPSLLAASALYLANVTTGEAAWPSVLSSSFGLFPSHFESPLHLLHGYFVEASSSEHRSVFEKYSHSSLGSVSQLSPPSSLPL